ncbi:hypothetical protein [Psychroserpens sp. MEBiC05023]
MKPKWYLGILIIALALLGSFASKEHAHVPNQEIVLQFSSEDVSPHDAQNAITIIKRQLETAGVADVKVQKLQEGQLKISYYSTSDVASIKALFSTEKNLDLGYVSFEKSQNDSPFEDQSIDYNLDVYEIQQSEDLSNLDGKLALETKTEYDRFFNPSIPISAEITGINVKTGIEKVAYKFQRTVAIAIDNNSYKIPEVRAGPCI